MSYELCSFRLLILEICGLFSNFCQNFYYKIFKFKRNRLKLVIPWKFQKFNVKRCVTNKVNSLSFRTSFHSDFNFQLSNLTMKPSVFLPPTTCIYIFHCRRLSVRLCTEALIYFILFFARNNEKNRNNRKHKMYIKSSCWTADECFLLSF